MSGAVGQGGLGLGGLLIDSIDMSTCVCEYSNATNQRPTKQPTTQLNHPNPN